MLSTRLLLLATLAGAIPAAGQTVRLASAQPADSTVKTDSTAKAKPARPLRYAAPVTEIQYIRPADQRGLNIFEAPKEEGAPYEGFKLNWGGAFTQQYQNLTHQNTAAPKM